MQRRFAAQYSIMQRAVQYHAVPVKCVFFLPPGAAAGRFFFFAAGVWCVGSCGGFFCSIMQRSITHRTIMQCRNHAVQDAVEEVFFKCPLKIQPKRTGSIFHEFRWKLLNVRLWGEFLWQQVFDFLVLVVNLGKISSRSSQRYYYAQAGSPYFIVFSKISKKGKGL